MKNNWTQYHNLNVLCDGRSTIEEKVIAMRLLFTYIRETDEIREQAEARLEKLTRYGSDGSESRRAEVKFLTKIADLN